ncbi:hypothetical protein GGI20_002379 [Coemansia sp. BCRC 34301]|nr:hypothetical protein GGI20_002379 [Coemansia sp. BCRC 34301]
MSATFSAARLAQLLRQRAESSLGGFARRAKRAAKFGTAPWFYASAGSVAGDSTEMDNGFVVFDKSKVNEQIPVKPVYIAPRNPMVLCHGLYGFDVRGPEKLPLLQVHYWRGIREALEGVGARVVIAKVPGTGGVRERAHQLDALLASRLAAEKVNIIGHSMGGLDARYLITHVEPKRYSVGTLTTVCTPHRGSPFMDWCRDYLSLGYRVDPDQLIRDFATLWRAPPHSPSLHGVGGNNPMGDVGGSSEADVLPDDVLRSRIGSIIGQVVAGHTPLANGSEVVDPGDMRLREFARFLTRLLGETASVGETSLLARLEQKSAIEGDYLARSASLLRMVYRRIMATLDTPAYACLTTDYCRRFFNPATPDKANVEYLSIGAHMDPTAVSDKINPLIIPHDIIYRQEGPNDGFVSLTSAQWGHYLGSVCADHFDFTNRWRVTSLGRDFISTVVYWSGKWSSWLNRNEAPAAVSKPKETTGSLGFGGDSKRFDPIDFYLRVGTILYERGY